MGRSPIPVSAVVALPPQAGRPERYNHRVTAAGLDVPCDGVHAVILLNMRHIDSAILDCTEWLCRKFQLMTGRTNVWIGLQLTNLSIVVYFVWAVVYFWNSDLVPRAAVALFCGALLYVLAQTVLKVPIETYENNAFHRVAQGLRNPRRVRDALLRTSFLTLSIVLFFPIAFVYISGRAPIVLLTYSLILLITVVLYVLACDPLPPCPGKLREWLRGSARSAVARSESPTR